MTCYKILSQKVPFEDHSSSDYDVLERHHPWVSAYVDDWACELLDRYWRTDLASLTKILKELRSQSVLVEKHDEG